MSIERPATAGGRADPQGYRADRDWEVLAICLAVLLAALLLDVHPDQRVGLRGTPTLVLPHLCGARDWLGVDCPGCGLTRSFVYLARGHWGDSFRAHRLGWLLAITVVFQLPYRAAVLARKKPLLPRWLRTAIGHALIALLVGNWLFSMVW